MFTAVKLQSFDKFWPSAENMVEIANHEVVKKHKQPHLSPLILTSATAELADGGQTASVVAGTSE